MYQPASSLIDFDAVRLRIASPDAITGWSHGEVTKPETINYRTQKPEKDGLFDERIFGPTKDWECYCGKYKKIRYKGIVCDKCGVEVTSSLVRRERMGHISLQAPVAHIWFLRGVPSKIGISLDMGVQSLEKVIYFADFIVTRVDETVKAELLERLKVEFKAKKKQIQNEADKSIAELNDSDAVREKKEDERDAKIKEFTKEFAKIEAEISDITPMRVISEQVFHELSMKYGHMFDASIGAEAVSELLSKLDLPAIVKQLETEVKKATPARQEKLIRRTKLLKSFIQNKIDPSWMIMTAVPVIPPDLRPMVALDGGRFATSDLNDLYRRVINRNNRLKRLLELNAPEVITRNEKRMLQEAVDALIDNSARHTKTVTASTGQKRSLRSLADVLKGKQGRFRANLLGKRTDYSGRSVIVVGPRLKLHQCGIPKRMALELFKPFVISRLIRDGHVHNVRSAARFIESGRSEVWDILEDVTKDHHVLLNRAPTLHRLGIQAFQPILIEGKAIQVHPLVCTAFNADFDGDQMAVHVPLTDEARREAKEIMLSSVNLLKPATGQPIVSPGKDIVWGCYYLTGEEGAETMKYFADPEDAKLAYAMKKIGLRQKITAYNVPGVEGKIETTVGRIIFNEHLPEGLPYYNEIMEVKKLSEMLRFVIEKLGVAVAAPLADAIKELGFTYATQAGYSWSMSDLPTIPEKQAILDSSVELVEEVGEQYAQGLLTENERKTKIIEIWNGAKEAVVKIAKTKLPKDGSVYSMVESGARGSWSQLIQMIGMKGLVANPSGDIIELPVKSCFKEGFSVIEYFISTHGARKGLSDTALRTANAGYLTRRLVDVSQDVVIRDEDCGDTTGILLTATESEIMGSTVSVRAMGRTSLDEVKDGKKVIIKAGEMINEDQVRALATLNISELRVRSILRCQTRKGVCAACYGYDLGANKPVRQGVAVGIIAAQSIGEPGTQLTMRTFHTGGVAGSDITQGLPRVEELFEVRTPKRKSFLSEHAGVVTIEVAERVIEKDGERIVATLAGQKIIRVAANLEGDEKYMVGEADNVLVKNGDLVVSGDAVMKRENGEDVIAAYSGTVTVGKKQISIAYKQDVIKEYIVPAGYIIMVKNGDTVIQGQQLTDGHIDPHELHELSGREATERYILKEIQGIYTSQGQKLNDKHIEVIIRQIFSRVLVGDPGETALLPGEVVEYAEFADENDKVGKGKQASGEYLLLGITKVSLSTRSFLSAASFQETAKVLINAAVTGKIDTLEGLKENVIIGRLIPAGTGLKSHDNVATTVSPVVIPEEVVVA